MHTQKITSSYFLLFLHIVIAILSVFNHMAFAAQPPTLHKKDVTILWDMSKTGMNSVESVDARTATADFIHANITDLAWGSRIRVFFFGQFSTPIMFKWEQRVGDGAEGLPNQLDTLRSRLLAIPLMVDKGLLTIQPQTSLMATLEAVGKLVDRTRPQEIIIVSDGFEFSANADSYQLVQQPQAELPRPWFAVPSLARVTMLGIGHGGNEIVKRRLEAMWLKWFQQLGVPQQHIRLLAVF